MEDKGIFIFKDAFSSQSVSAFCLYDDSFPLIYINSSRAIVHQTFSLFHELAHLMLGLGGMDIPEEWHLRQLEGKYRKIERVSSRFAASVLVPEADFEEQVKDRHIDEQEVQDLARRYKVSREVVLRRCLEKALIDSAYYNRMVAKWRTVKARKREGGPDYYTKKRLYREDRYLELVFSNYYQRKISIGQAADYLGVTAGNVPKLAESLLPKDMVA